MALLPAGAYRPLYAPAGAPTVRVVAFYLDREPVTRGQYLAFVRVDSAWRRTAVRRVFAERGYLADWRGDLDAGDAAGLARPATGVSWFAAKAYCAARGDRLPTTDEWEYAGAASESRRDASGDPSFIPRLLALYQARRPDGAGTGFRNAFGVADLHGVVWEWTLDFNGVVVADDSRGTGSGVDARDHHLFCASAAIGATDPSNYPAFLRYAVRAGLTGRTTTQGLGFRCAADAR